MTHICPQGPTFHWDGGWMFTRGEAGYVHIWRDGHNLDIELKIPPNEWLSILKHLGPTPGDNSRVGAEPTTLPEANALAEERRPNSEFESRDGSHKREWETEEEYAKRMEKFLDSFDYNKEPR